MHEFFVASGIMETVLEEAKKHGAGKVSKIVLEIGPLSMISVEQLEFALDILSEGTIACGAAIECRITPVTLKCENNHVNVVAPAKLDFFSLTRIPCPACGAKTRPVGGRDCMIKEISAE